jgi:tryptophanyl-tRNA synthetase
MGPIRLRYEELLGDPAQVWDILHDGAERAQQIASETMRQVREVMGLR